MRNFFLVLIALTAVNTSHADTKLYVFDCGFLSFPDVSSFGLTNDETDVREMFVPCYLIEHQGKRMLWDSGLPLAAAGAGEMEVPPGALMRYDRSIVQQLESMGIAPGDIDYLALSHFHFDHVGGAKAFANATLLIQSAEYDAAFLHADQHPYFEPSLYSELQHADKRILNGDLDLFGDGVVNLISAPGHTPGHQVLLLRLPKFGPLLISGDLYHFEASRELRRTPVFNSDAARTLESMTAVETLVQQTGATFWIEHNKALADTLKKAPEYYE